MTKKQASTTATQLPICNEQKLEDSIKTCRYFENSRGLGGWSDRLPDETTILRFRHLLEEHKLAPKLLQAVNEMLRGKGLLLRWSMPR